VSLTEDPIAEIPVARDLARRAEYWWATKSEHYDEQLEEIDPFSFQRRDCSEISLSKNGPSIGEKHPPVVLAHSTHALSKTSEIVKEMANVQVSSKDAPVEGLILRLNKSDELTHLAMLRTALLGAVPCLMIDDHRDEFDDDSIPPNRPNLVPLLWHAQKASLDSASLARFLTLCEESGNQPVLSIDPKGLDEGVSAILANAPSPLILTLSTEIETNLISGYRELAVYVSNLGLHSPIWIRNWEGSRLFPEDDLHSARILDASVLSGSLLCDGIGDVISVEHTGELNRNRGLAYNLLQGARARISKTEFVACPSCGRTLFDLQSTTQRVKQATGHLKGVTIAVMGCIVNGPGEMADADFGYVGSGPGKIDLYVSKNRIKSAIPEKDAVDQLVQLIKQEGKWIAP
jgi:(E)-4-hydroxy-3-methylbut-2-enyl-diphosphate synthase